MKLAAIYNIWDGEEWLEKSINSIREHVDVVICVSSLYSGWGEFYPGGLTKAQELKKRGLVDSHRKFDGSGSNPQKIEINKRLRGLELAKEQGCTHFLYMDCDELYNPKQFAEARNMVDKNNYAATACSIQSYYKWKYKAKNLDNYYVPFICKIFNSTTHARRFPAYVDPTRGVKPNKPFYLFSSEEVVMHHHTWSRNDIKRKFNNSTAKMNGNNDHLLKTYNDIKEGFIMPDGNVIVKSDVEF